MKPPALTIASLLSIVLLPLHVGGDIRLGFDRGGPGLVYVVVPVLWEGDRGDQVDDCELALST